MNKSMFIRVSVGLVNIISKSFEFVSDMNGTASALIDLLPWLIGLIMIFIIYAYWNYKQWQKASSIIKSESSIDHPNEKRYKRSYYFFDVFNN